jgi:AcrR family transcriptional regulator
MTAEGNVLDAGQEPPRAAGRAAATRRALLDAAREVFAAAGFAEASIADVVNRAGASVGSLYHHFGGKADLYLALYEQFADSQEAQAATAVAAARSAADQPPAELFLAGARAYLEGCWAERDVARLFLAGGGPPGFELVVRRRHRDWVRANATLLQAEDEPFDEALVLVLTTVVGEAGAEVAISESAEKASALADAVLELVARVMTPRR